MDRGGKQGHRRAAQTQPDVQHRPGREVSRPVLGFDKVWFSSHALERMKQRGVSESEVFKVLEQPARKGLPTQPGRNRWRRGHTDVVFEKWPNQLCIVTVIVIEG